MKQVSNGNGVVCFKNADEICRYIKEDTNQLCYLVKREKLPAWKRNGRGPWRALSIDLDNWMIFQRDKYLKDTPRYIKDDKFEDSEYLAG